MGEVWRGMRKGIWGNGGIWGIEGAGFWPVGFGKRISGMHFPKGIWEAALRGWGLGGLLGEPAGIRFCGSGISHVGFSDGELWAVRSQGVRGLFFGKTGFLEKVSPARGCGASPEPEQPFGTPWARGLNPPFPKFPQLCFHGRSSSRCFGAFPCAQGGARGEVTAGCDTGDWTLLHPPAHPCGAARAPRGSTNSSEFLGIVGNSCPPHLRGGPTLGPLLGPVSSG